MKQAVSDNSLRKLLKTSRQYRMPKGQIMQTSDHRVQLNLIVEGFVKRYLISNDGTLSVQSIFGPDYIFPLTPVFRVLLDQSLYSGPEVIYYEAIVESQIYSMDLAVLKEHVDSDKSLYKDLFSESGVRLEDNIQRLENLALKTSYKRLAHQIAYFARHFGQENSKGTKLNLPLTHQDLADILSLTRETVSTSMVELRKKNLIITQKDIFVPDIKKLEDEAYS
jgi:CRP-like cAMP-binding protein